MLKNYIKIAFKVFLRRKFFTFISLFAISFTLVVLMVAVAFLDHTFGKQPPENKQDRTLCVFHMVMKTPDGGGTWSSGGGYKFFDRYARNLNGVEKMSLCTETEPVFSYHNGEKIQSYLKRTDGEFWQILEFTFLEGAPFTSDDEKNVNFVAVINDATRKKFFGDESAAGKTIEADGQRFRVVGVVANVPYLRRTPFADIWVPISTMKTNNYRGELMGNFNALFLARSRSDFLAIKDEFQVRLKQVEFPDPREWNQMYGVAETYFENTSRSAFGRQENYQSQNAKFLAALIGAMILFMLLPTINLININVSRIMERASEIGVRKAFGASSWTLVWQFVVENVLLTLIGGAIGFALSRFVLQAITKSGFFPYAEFHLNYRVFLYGLALAIFFGLMSGVYPAWKMSRLHPVQALKG
ncbi:MAG: FtsX-like permease family protein [Acidobacteria bacterium]|nr:FtsX-like permease family protein [Acidobacteriota bacterium]